MTEDSSNAMHTVLTASGMEYSALSWSGFELFGNRKSIDEVHRLIGVEARVKELEERLIEAESQLPRYMERS